MTLHGTRRNFMRSAILSGVAMTCAPAAIAAPSAKWAKLAELVRGQCGVGGLAGCSVGLARQGVSLFSATAGWANIAQHRPVGDSTLFHIASITKVIIAKAIMSLVAQGRLDLDEPVDKAAGFAVRSSAFPDVPITMRQLLTHTSGISDRKYYEIDFRSRGGDSPVPLDRFVADYLEPGGLHYAATNYSMDHPPGTHWDYSNVGYALAGMIGERITGDFRAYIAEYQFAPLGVVDAHWNIADLPADREGLPYDTAARPPALLEPVGLPDWPAGGLRMRADDLARVLSASPDEGRDIAMFENRSVPGLAPWLTGQGLGWQFARLAERELPNHWGGDPGVITAAYYDPDTRACVAVLATGAATREARDAIKTIARTALEAVT